MALPLLNTIRDHYKQARKARKEGKWVDLATYIFLIITFGVGSIFWLISGYRNAFPNGVFPQRIHQEPKRELSYEKEGGNVPDPNTGIYEAVFTLKVLTPSGNSEGSPKFKSKILGAKCSDDKHTISRGETKGSIIFWESYFKIICASQTPIIDNGHLFSLY
ncbi:MAG: hypothetical protein AAB915_00720 [Patescibacteria group bacterium]